MNQASWYEYSPCRPPHQRSENGKRKAAGTRAEGDLFILYERDAACASEVVYGFIYTGAVGRAYRQRNYRNNDIVTPKNKCELWLLSPLLSSCFVCYPVSPVTSPNSFAQVGSRLGWLYRSHCE